MRFDEIAVLNLTTGEIARRTGAPLEGGAELELVHFTSPHTGRQFTARPSREPSHAAVHTEDYPDQPAERSSVLADLFDTLCIDLDDTSSVRGDLPSRWNL